MKAGVIMMKKTMKKLMAALLALACVPVTGMTANAVDGYWGTTSWAEFNGNEPLDHHGMFGDSIVYVGENNAGGVIRLVPRRNYMRFILRDDVDPAEAGKQIAEVLDAYFPGMAESYNTDTHHAKVQNVQLYQPWVGVNIEKTYDLNIPELPENTAALELNILRDLAKKHLLSAFYGWGETADYSVGYFSSDVMEDMHLEEAQEASVQAYLDEHHPGYTLERYKAEDIEPVDTNGKVFYRYRIALTEELTYREKVALACELYGAFQIRFNFGFLESSEQSALGHNALERPGDTNLDCAVDILDVIAANKHILGVGTLDKTGLKNADMNGNGTADSEDSLAILKKVLQ